jgi:hypothetical protein
MGRTDSFFPGRVNEVESAAAVPLVVVVVPEDGVPETFAASAEAVGLADAIDDVEVGFAGLEAGVTFETS